MPTALARCVAIVFVLYCPAHASAQAAFQPGLFEGLMLAVDSRGKIAGYFHQEQGEAPSKTCAFFLAGKAAPGEIAVVTWSKDVHDGTLKTQKDGVTLKIPKGRDHPGCGLVLPPQIAQGLELDRTGETRWIDLRKIAAQRVYLHSAPDSSGRLRAFVVAGDVVGVRSVRGEWLEVDYVGSARSTTGWIRAQATAGIAPPYNRERR
jgi:hypothetical protein